MSEKEKAALRAIINAILDTIGEFPDGAPSGPLYMALSAGMGMSFPTYQQIMGVLVSEGMVTHSNHQYFLVKK